LPQLAEGKKRGILVYCLSSISGGAVSYLRNLAPLLDKQFEKSSDGHSLKFLAHEDQQSLLASIDDLRIVWIEGRRPTGYRRILWERMNISRLVRQEAIDVLFTPYQIGPRTQGVKHVMMIRNMEPFLFAKYRYGIVTWLRNQLLRRESSRLLRAADRVIAVSEFVRDELINGIGVEKTRMLQARGIEVGMFIMLGYEGEEIADIEATVEHLKKSNPDAFLTTVAYPIKGTKFYDDVAERVMAQLEWDERTDRDLLVSGRHSRRFYDHATRWMVNEVGLNRARRSGSTAYLAQARMYLNARRGRIGMQLTRHEREGGGQGEQRGSGRGWHAEDRAASGW
jgi:glycosyltransferase involved in cell wall biosynthesis